MTPAPRLTALAALAAVAVGCAPAAPPDILLLSVDTTRRDHLPFYGYARDTAPRWSRLAREGVVFDDAVAVNSNTAPSHASMLTGLYPGQHGIEDNGGRLRDGVPLLPELLRPLGYESAAFVSAAPLAESVGLGRGFDLYRQAYDPEQRHAVAADTVAAARAWLAARPAAAPPFLLFLHLYDPHFPYHAHPRIEREFLGAGAPPPPGDGVLVDHVKREHQQGIAVGPAIQRRLVARYDAEIRYADAQSALLLDDLERLGPGRPTLVVLVSDHGETLFDREWVCDHGARVYEEQVRIPLVLRLPGGRAAGRRIGAPVGHVDLLPTILEVAGAAPPVGLPGRSLLPLLERESAADRERPTFSSARAMTQRVPELGAELQRGFVLSVRSGGKKLTRYPGRRGPIWQLHDLERDPGERDDRTRRSRGDLDRLRRLLGEWQAATGSDDGPVERPLDAATAADLRALGYLD